MDGWWGMQEAFRGTAGEPELSNCCWTSAQSFLPHRSTLTVICTHTLTHTRYWTPQDDIQNNTSHRGFLKSVPCSCSSRLFSPLIILPCWSMKCQKMVKNVWISVSPEPKLTSSNVLFSPQLKEEGEKPGGVHVRAAGTRESWFLSLKDVHWLFDYQSSCQLIKQSD